MSDWKLADGFKVPPPDPNERVRAAHYGVMMIREGRALGALFRFLLGDADALVPPPCPHVYFTTDLSPSGWTRHVYSITCLACGAIVDGDA